MPWTGRIEYDEKSLLKKLPGTEKRQLYNLKTHLYKQILASLRLLKSADSLDLQLNEQFDYAHILYKKGLFFQSLKILGPGKGNCQRPTRNFISWPRSLHLKKELKTCISHEAFKTGPMILAVEANMK